MEVSEAIVIGRNLFTTSLLLVAPIVIVSLVVGVLISIAQTVTSIQEQTLTFAPRIVAVVAIIFGRVVCPGSHDAADGAAHPTLSAAAPTRG